MKIIIYSPSYQESSGGITVLHKLCDILIRQGFDAGFFVNRGEDFYTNSTYMFKAFSLEDIDTEKDIVVYPEIIFGNPLQCKKVVRYILNVGHVTLGRKDTWGESDYWVYYSERFYDKLRPAVYLNIIDSKEKYFKDYSLDRNYEECFSYRKSHEYSTKVIPIHNPDAIEIGFNMSDESLIRIFNSCKRFYCYDTESYLSVLASLCGCDSIVVPNETVSRDLIMKQFPFEYGIAYGEEEIPLARKSRENLRKVLQVKELKQEEEVKNLFNTLCKTL